jgi:hypothetical protein
MTQRSLKPLLLPFAACAILMLPLLAQRAHAEVKKSELNNTMEDMDESWKKLKRTLRKPDQNAESLKLLADMQAKSLTCKGMIPTKAEKVPEADRAKFITAYRKEMTNLLIDLCNIEQAILDGDNAKAVDLYKATNERQDKDHDQFMQKDKDKEKDKK